MTRKRERLEIIRDILIVIQGLNNVRHAKLLRASNLSPQMFKQYVEELMQKEFIKEVREKKLKYFEIKNKGIDFLKEYRVIESIVKNFGL